MMKRAFKFVFGSLCLAATMAHACDDPNKHGFAGYGALSKKFPASNAPQQPVQSNVIQMAYQPVIATELDETGTLKLTFSSNEPLTQVALSLKSSQNLKFISEIPTALESASGTQELQYQITRPGYTYIRATLEGDLDGITQRKSVFIFVPIKKS